MTEEIRKLLNKAYNITEQSMAEECLSDFSNVETALKVFYEGKNEPDFRLMKLLVNLRHYVENWLENKEYSREWCKCLIKAIGNTLEKAAIYDFEIRDNPDLVIKRNNDNLKICDKLFQEEKLPVEESLDKSYDISIFMVTYNQIDLSKLCLESIFKNTDDVSYEVFLIDNGSSDGSYEHFKHDSRLKIIRLVENVGLLLALQIFYESHLDSGRFWMYMNNDVVVTPRWALQLLNCIRSDPKIGMVVPYTNRTSAFFSMDATLGLYDIDKIQGFGESYNVSNPMQWVDLKMVYPFVGLLRPSIKRNFGYFEDGFYFKFYYADADYVISMIKSGYRAIQCRDTYVHHFDGGSSTYKGKRKMLDKGEYDFFKKHGFFASDIDKGLPVRSFDFNNSVPRNILLLGYSRGNVAGMIKTAHIFATNRSSSYFAADTMERFNCDSLWDDIPFEKMQSWYDVENIFPDMEFDLIMYLDNIATMRNPKLFLERAESRLRANGKIMFILEQNTSAVALDYIFLCGRKSMRDACRLRKNTLMDLNIQLEMIRQAGLVVLTVSSDFIVDTKEQAKEKIFDKYGKIVVSDESMTRFEKNICILGYTITAKKRSLVDSERTMQEILSERIRLP